MLHAMAEATATTSPTGSPAPTGSNDEKVDGLVRCFGMLSTGDLLNAAQVCREWRLAANDGWLWKLAIDRDFEGLPATVRSATTAAASGAGAGGGNGAGTGTAVDGAAARLTVRQCAAAHLLAQPHACARDVQGRVVPRRARGLLSIRRREARSVGSATAWVNAATDVATNGGGAPVSDDGSNGISSPPHVSSSATNSSLCNNLLFQILFVLLVSIAVKLWMQAYDMLKQY